jgi:hypothetical protein
MNYAWVKMIFTSMIANQRQLFDPHLLVDYLTDNKAKGVHYAKMPASERRAWLRIWLHMHFD